MANENNNGNHGAPFDEQIRISLDVTSLEGQFQQVADLWKSTLAEMGASAPGLLQTINTSSINRQLKDLSDTLTGFVDNFQASFGEIGATISEALGSANASVTRALNPSGVRAGTEEAQRNLEYLKQFREELPKVQRELENQQEGVVNTHQIANDKMASADDKLFAQTLRKYEKLAADRKKIEEEYLQQQYKMENEAAARSNDLHNMQFHGVSRGGGNEDHNADRQQLSNYFAELQDAEGEVKSPLSATSRFSKELLKDLPRLFAGVVRFQAAWAGVGLVLEGIVELVKAPIQLLERGFEELSLMEDKAAELSGVLATGFNFSGDFAKNLELAAGYSKQVADELQQVAAASGLKFESLVNVFKIFSNSGIAGFTKNLGEVVTLTQQFATLLHAGGIESENSRRILSELPKLLNGSATGAELMLRTLGLSKDEWNKIRVEGQQHGDLVQRLAPYMQPYIKQLEATKGTLSSMKEQLKEALDADGAKLAEGLFKEMKTSLGGLIDLLKDSNGLFEDMGVLVGGVAKALVHMFDTTHVFRNEAGDLGSPFKNIVGYVAGIVAGLGVAIEHIGFMMKSMDAFEAQLTGTVRGLLKAGEGMGALASGHLPTAVENFGDSKKALLQDTDKDVEEARKGRDARVAAIRENYNAAIANLRSAEAVKDSAVDLGAAGFNGGKDVQPPKEKKTHPGNDLSLLREQMQDRLSLAKESTQAGIDMAKEDLAARKIGEQELHDFVVRLLQDEKKQVDEIMGAYKDAVAGASNVKPRDREKTLDAAGRLQGTTQAGIDHQITQANISLDNEQYANKVRLLQQQYEFEAKIAQQSVDLARRSGASQEEVVRMQTAANEREYNNRRHLLELELAEYRNVAEKKQQIQQQMDQLDKAHDASTAIDNQSRINAKANDAILAAQQQQAAQHADFDAARRQANDPQLGDVDPQQRRDRLTQLAAAYERMTHSQLATIANIKREAEAWHADAAILKQIDSLYQKASADERGAQSTLKQAQDRSDVGGDFFERVFGPGVRSMGDFGKKTTTDSDGRTVVKFDASTAAEELGSAFEVFGGQVGQIVSAFKNGGAAKGLGALGQTVGADLSAAGFGAAGAIVSVAGSVVSMIGDAFTSAARKIGDNIKKAFDLTMKTYEQGGATLADTITSVNAERQRAISELSGKKGGQKELDKLLPDFQSQIYQLQKQAAETQLSFMLSLSKLDQGNLEPLNGMVDLWKQINKEVKDFISAGGQAADAQRYVSETLAQYRKQVASEFSQENEQAVEDALNLNELLRQRVDLDRQSTELGRQSTELDRQNAQIDQDRIDLQRQLAQQTFEALNKGALERRASDAVTSGTALQQAQQQFKLQMQQQEKQREQLEYQREQLEYQRQQLGIQTQQLNSQIALTQQKVDKEREIFNIASDYTSLLAQSNALQIEQLNQQLALYRQQKEVIDNLVTDASGNTLMTQFLSNLFGQGNITTPGSPITINVTVGSGASPTDTTNAVLDALNQAGRYGTGTDVQTFYN
jgi:putative ubiquitin-RnfH superfamily antitoxin RatB of RatAB toxin-antitoxin module